MRQMWSPWRSQYIQSFKEDDAEDKSCFLCAAIRQGSDDESALVVNRRSHCFVIMNRYPYNSGHIMVVPLRHIGNLASLDDDELVQLMRTIRDASEVLKSVFRPHGINIGANLGREAGAGVPDHLHFHLVPRWGGDTNFMPVLADVKVVSESMSDTWRKLNEAFNSAHAKNE